MIFIHQDTTIKIVWNCQTFTNYQINQPKVVPKQSIQQALYDGLVEVISNFDFV